MAKSLGKQSVLCETILDGVAQGNFRIENRVVYANSDGTYEVNFLEGRRKVTRKPDGSFYWGFVVTSVRTTPLADFLAGFSR